MAVWISRAVGLTPEPSSASSRFSDVDADMWWAPHVEVLADLRIVSGCGTSPARFCPNDAVTRGQMATTLVRAFGRSGVRAFGRSGVRAFGRSGVRSTTRSQSGFIDIADSVHAASIGTLAASGVGTGRGVQPLRFCPDRLLTRNGGAALVHEAMLQHEDPFSGRGWVSYDLPEGEMVETVSGKPVSLRSLVDGARPMLLWFLSPW